MKKKILSVLLCALITLALAACGPTRNPDFMGDGDYTKLTGEVKFLLPGDSIPADSAAVTAAINAKLKADGRNYTVNFQYEGWADYWKKIALRSNEGYDAAWMHADKISGMYGQKILKPLDEYLKMYGKTLTDTTPDLYWSTTKISGSIYAVPRIAPLAETYSLLTVRGDWMDEYGMDDITTLSQLDEYLQKTHEKLSGTTGAYVMDKDHSDFLRREYAKNYYFPIGSFSCYPVYIDVSQKVDGKYKVQSFYESDAFKNMANKANEYYTKGYRNPSRTALGSNSMDAYFNQSLLGAIWSTPLKVTERIEAFSAEIPTGEIRDVVLNPTEDKWIFAGENSICAFSKSDKTPHLIDFLSWLRQDRANFDLLAYGVKGVNYNLTEDGKLDFTGIPDNKNYSLLFPAFAFSTTENVRYSNLLSDEQIQAIGSWDEGDNVKVSPLIGFVPEIKGALNIAYSQVSAVEKSYSEEFMYGMHAVPSAKYTEFINQLKANRLQQVIDELQKQVDAFCTANGLY